MPNIAWPNESPIGGSPDSIGGVIRVPGGSLIPIVRDPVWGQPQYQYVPDPGSRTQLVNGRIVNMDTGQIIADLSAIMGGGGGGTTPYQQGQLDMGQQDLAERQRQYNETFGFQKAQYNTNTQMAQAQQEWQKAVDARDFASAEYWRNQAFGLQQQQFQEQQYTDQAGIAQNQNRQAFDYTALLSQMSGPQDYGKYWYASRGMTQPRGEAAIPYEQAIPSAFQPMALPRQQPYQSGPAFAPGGAPAAPAASVPAFIAPDKRGAREAANASAGIANAAVKKVGFSGAQGALKPYALTDKTGAATGVAFQNPGGGTGSVDVNNKIIGYGPNGEPIFA